MQSLGTTKEEALLTQSYQNFKTAKALATSIDKSKSVITLSKIPYGP